MSDIVQRLRRDGRWDVSAQFRIAFRKEGAWVIAYLAEPGTMVGAVQLASVAVSLLEHPETWREYRGLISRALNRSGLPMADIEQPAPEHERAGDA